MLAWRCVRLQEAPEGDAGNCGPGWWDIKAGSAHLMRLAEQQPASDGVKDVGCDVGSPRRLWGGASCQEHGVGVQVLQLQAPVSQDLHGKLDFGS